MLTLSLETSDKIFLSQSDTKANKINLTNNSPVSCSTITEIQNAVKSFANTMPDNSTAMMAINVQSVSVDYFGGGVYHAMICKADNLYFSCLCQSYASKNSFNIVFGQFQNTSWQWKPLVSVESTDTDITSQVTPLSTFVLNSVHSYYHNGTEYLTIGFHNSSGTIPFNNRYSVCQLPSAYAGKTIIFLNTIGNNANSFNGNTMNADVPGFYRNTDRNVVCDFHLADSVDKTHVYALQINLIVIS